MGDLAHGRVASFAAIARREGKAERHIRLLAPLAFLSPRIVSALLDGAVPADLTLTQLASGLPYSWIEQEGRIDLRINSDLGHFDADNRVANGRHCWPGAARRG